MKTKKMILVFGVALIMVLSGVLVSPTQAGEKGKKDKPAAPQAVLTAFQTAYPKATIKSVAEETKDGQTFYEIESMDQGTRRDLLYKSDGTVFEIEEAIAAADLPAAVVNGLKATYPEAKTEKAEKITRGNTVEYEVLLENDEDTIEVVIDSSGKIISHKAIAEEDEGDEPDED